MADGVICLECGAVFKRLPGHLCKHNLSSDYKAKWGYNRTTPLETLSTRKKKKAQRYRNETLDAYSARCPSKADRGDTWPSLAL
jgi:predicted transcriptional regulator